MSDCAKLEVELYVEGEKERHAKTSSKLQANLRCVKKV